MAASRLHANNVMGSAHVAAVHNAMFRENGLKTIRVSW